MKAARGGVLLLVVALTHGFVPRHALPPPRLTLTRLETEESVSDSPRLETEGSVLAAREEPAPRAASGRVGGRAVGDSATERGLASAQKLTRNTERATFRLLARAPLAALGGSLAVIALLAAGVSALLFGGGGDSSYYYFESSEVITTSRQDADGKVITNTKRSGGVRTNLPKDASGQPRIDDLFGRPPLDLRVIADPDTS